jgi:glutamine synthetase type III
MVENELDEMRTETARKNASDVRTRLNQGLDRLENELKEVRRAANELPVDTGARHDDKRLWRFWPWNGIFFF